MMTQKMILELDWQTDNGGDNANRPPTRYRIVLDPFDRSASPREPGTFVVEVLDQDAMGQDSWRRVPRRDAALSDIIAAALNALALGAFIRGARADRMHLGTFWYPP